MVVENIGLELLVRKGNISGVEKFLVENKITNDTKLAETHIYDYIIRSSENPGDVFDHQEVFNSELVAPYLETTDNIPLLCELLGVDESGCDAGMSIIDGINLLEIDSVSSALQRNISNNELKQNVTRFIRNAYAYTFYPTGTGWGIEQLFTPIDSFRDLVDPTKVVANSIQEWEDKSPIGPEGYTKDFTYEAIPIMIKMTNRETVSELIHKYLDSEDYEMMCTDGIIDKLQTQKKLSKVEKAVQKFESERVVYDFLIPNFAKSLNGKGTEYVAKRMGVWFKEGKMSHLVEVARFEDGRLYDHDIAKQELSYAISDAWQKNDLARLDWALDLPEKLIDDSFGTLQDFVSAYKIHNKTE